MKSSKLRRRPGWVMSALLAAGGVCVTPARPAEPFANWLNGADGYEQAMERRRGTSDSVLLYFYTDWCPHCRRFNREIAQSSEMEEYVQHAIAVRINPEQGDREKALADRYDIEGFPTLLILSSAVEQAQDVSAYRTSPAEFVEACRRAGSRHGVKKRSAVSAQSSE